MMHGLGESMIYPQYIIIYIYVYIYIILYWVISVTLYTHQPTGLDRNHSWGIRAALVTVSAAVVLQGKDLRDMKLRGVSSSG